MKNLIHSFKFLIHWSKSAMGTISTPWRIERNPYTTLVSEFMLQQTTYSTVKKYYGPFIEKFPNLETLAKASENEIRAAWIGLGYYARARNLHQACKIIKEEYQGIIPMDYIKLTSIKGIGPYTANALLGIGYDLPYLAIDVNLERVFSRLFLLENPKKMIPEQKEILKLVEKFSARDLNETLMDFGRIICTKKNPSCASCPISSLCKVFSLGLQDKYPIPKPKIEKIPLELMRLIIIDKKEKMIGVIKKEKSFWLSDQYEFPTYILNTKDSQMKQYPWISSTNLNKIEENYSYLGEISSSITKYKIKNHLYLINSKKRDKQIKYVSYFDPLLSSLCKKIIKKFDF